MNRTINQQVDSTLNVEGKPTDIWEDLSKTYPDAIDRHIP